MKMNIDNEGQIVRKDKLVFVMFLLVAAAMATAFLLRWLRKG